MTQRKIETGFAFKSVKPRFIILNEDIRQALDIYSLSLYLTFRNITNYTQDISSVKRSAKFLYTDAKMSRDKFYRCLNILENHGLIYREPENPLNSISVYHVAHDLNTFNTECDPVFEKDTPVFDKDTDHKSFSLINNNTMVSEEVGNFLNYVVDIKSEEKEKPRAFALDDDIETLKKYEIKPPKKLGAVHKRYVEKAKALLSEQNLTLNDYLDYLTNRCSRALLPYIANNVERQNGFGNILRPSFITDVLNGKWKD